MLEKLLSARKRHPHLVVDPPVVKDSEAYSKRDQHINHDKTDTAPSNLLLDVVEIGLRSQRIVPELEMIDLPGLGQGARDTYLTRKFLPQLDGTLIFYKAQNFTEHVGEEAFASLREVFEGQIKGRVWLVVTYFDGLTREHLYGRRDNQVTAFDYLDKLLKDNRMTPDMVCFLSKKLYDPVQATGKNNDRLTAKRTLGIRDEDDYPPRLGQMDPALRTAFDELLKDGGIDHLRRLITHKVADEVRQQTSQWCGRKLQSIQTDLTAVLRNEVKVAEMGDDWIIQVTTYRNRIRDVLETTLHRNPRFEEVATAMRDALARQFVEVFPNTPGQNRLLFQELGEEFTTHARILENQLEKTTSEKLVGSLYDDVGTKLTGLPAVEVLRYESPTDAWEAFRREDLVETAWRAQHHFPTFHSADLFRTFLPDHAGQFNGIAYRAFMLEKIRVTSHAAVHAIRMRLRERLTLLNLALRKLAVGTGQVRSGSTAQRLGELLKTIQGA